MNVDERVMRALNDGPYFLTLIATDHDLTVWTGTNEPHEAFRLPGTSISGIRSGTVELNSFPFHATLISTPSGSDDAELQVI